MYNGKRSFVVIICEKKLQTTYRSVSLGIQTINYLKTYQKEGLRLKSNFGNLIEKLVPQLVCFFERLFSCCGK